jgi:hypothetical protein
MKKLPVVVVLSLLAVPSLAFGQAPTPQPPQPGPEVQKLAYFLGTWKAEGELIGGPSAGRFSGAGSCEWFAGGFHAVCRREGTGPAGKSTELEIFTYDAEAKAYTRYGITSRGMTLFVKGSLAGNTWTWLWEERTEGTPTTYRIRQVQVSPTYFTLKVDYSVDGGPWIVIEEGKVTRVK